MISPGDALYVDLDAIDTGDGAWSLRRALTALGELQTTLDRKLAETTGGLALPCRTPRDRFPDEPPPKTALPVVDSQSPCSLCCHESVFLTPLEWFAVVDYMQQHFEPAQLEAAVARGLALYDEHQALIEALCAPPPDGARDHFAIAERLKFACPLLGPSGCSIYPARELYGRLFGQSFNAEHGIYGCKLSGAFFQGQTATLALAPAWARQLGTMPLTGFRQVYPYYFHITYRTNDQGF